MLRCSRNRSKQKREVDKLIKLMNYYKNSEVSYVQKMHELIPFDNMYLQRLEGNFNNYNGLKYYTSFEEYVNILVIPHIKKQNTMIGDLK